eukprot:GILI01002619.1.p2 GENE.GILI01002619.1~~GILI01002619.1.p2  ORF type:complete len:199 (-),score=29.05 GILI01002619.1:559-1089(-)
MVDANVDAVIAEISDLLRSSQSMPYIGEAVSQYEHMLQAAHCAVRDGMRDDVVLAALLHDIGHICVGSDVPQMGGFGVKDHESIGADYARTRGFSADVCALIRSHVDAKRYLTFKKGQDYYDRLSDASKATLAFQGGPMTAEEAAAFEADPLCAEKIKMRLYDEEVSENYASSVQN